MPDKLKNLVKAEALFRQKNQNELNEKKPNKYCLIVKKDNTQEAIKLTQKNKIQPETEKKEKIHLKKTMKCIKYTPIKDEKNV